MIKKPRKIALGTVAIAAVIILFATGPVVATHQAEVWFQAVNAQGYVHDPSGHVWTIVGAHLDIRPLTAASSFSA